MQIYPVANARHHMMIFIYFIYIYIICMRAQSHALGTRTKFQLEILTINVIFGIVYFREITLESSWNVSETGPRHQGNRMISVK